VLYTAVVGLLLSASLVAACLLPLKRYNFLQLGRNELTTAVTALLAGAFVVAAATAIAIWRMRKSGRRWALVDLPAILGVCGAWYVLSFCGFYSVDRSFPFAGGTTLYCYESPILGIYEPLFRAAVATGWRGGCPYSRGCDGWEREDALHSAIKELMKGDCCNERK